MPAAELAGPSTSLKGLLSTEGRGSAWSIRLDWTSLYTEATRPVAGAGDAAPPLSTNEGLIVVVSTHTLCEIFAEFRCDCVNLSNCLGLRQWGCLGVGFEKGEIVFSGFGLSAMKVSCPVDTRVFWGIGSSRAKSGQ